MSRVRATTTRNVYDVFVVGPSLSGAFIAAELARRGKQVLYVPGGRATPEARVDGLVVPVQPFFLPSAEASPALTALSTPLGLTEAITAAARSTSIQFLSPGDFRELSREFVANPELPLWVELAEAREASRTLGTWFDKNPTYPPEGLWNRLRGASPPSFELPCTAPEWRSLTLLAQMTSGLALPQYPSMLVAQHLPYARLFPGGREGLRAFCAERAAALSADVLPPTETIEKIDLARGGAIEMKLTFRPHAYRASQIVLSQAPEELVALLGGPPPVSGPPLYRSGGRLVTITAVFKESAIPRGLSSVAIVDGEEPIAIQLIPLESAPHRHCRAMLLTFVADDATEDAELFERIWAKLEFAMPFTREQALLEVLHRGPELLALEHPSGLVGYSTSTKNSHVQLAGNSNFPGLGLEGEARAALRVLHGLAPIPRSKNG